MALMAVTVLAYWPIGVESLAKDARAYAVVLSAPDFQGQAPTRIDYERARGLLLDPAIEQDPMVKASLLLTESNLAIQFEDAKAAKRFIQTNAALCHVGRTRALTALHRMGRSQIRGKGPNEGATQRRYRRKR